MGPLITPTILPINRIVRVLNSRLLIEIVSKRSKSQQA